jgi:hypothetical protein
MTYPHFVRIDREGRQGERHFVVHTHDPRFTAEFAEDGGPAGKGGKGVLKRVCVPNSWAGDYSRYAQWLTRAQEFFEAAAPGSGPAPRR